MIRKPARAFTLIDMMTTVAALVIIMGLMVSLARYVRNQSAGQITRRVLVQLEMMLGRYENQYQSLPDVPPLVDDARSSAGEQALLNAAERNNRSLAAALRGQTDEGRQSLSDLPGSAYDGQCVRDGWGTPIVLMTPGAVLPRSGRRSERVTAMGGRSFVSAGPDRMFSTPEDNLYSKELVDAAKNTMGD